MTSRQVLRTAAAQLERYRQDDSAARLLDAWPRIREMVERGQLSPRAARTVAWYLWCGLDAAAYYPHDDPMSLSYHAEANIWAPFLTTNGRMRALRLNARAFSAMIDGTATHPDGYYPVAVPAEAAALLLTLDPARPADLAVAHYLADDAEASGPAWDSWGEPHGVLWWVGTVLLVAAGVAVVAFVLWCSVMAAGAN